MIETEIEPVFAMDATRKTREIADLDQRIKTLSAATRGLRGEVLRQAHPEKYEAKRAELRAATAEYFRYYFDTPSVSMP